MKKIDGATQVFVRAASCNNVLSSQLTELTDRLPSLNFVLNIAQEVSGLALDIPEIPDTLLERWQLHRTDHRIHVWYACNMLEHHRFQNYMQQQQQSKPLRDVSTSFNTKQL